MKKKICGIFQEFSQGEPKLLVSVEFVDEKTERKEIEECEKRKIEKIRQAEKLDCDICGKHIAYCYDMDLNGSLFICDDCYNKNNEKTI